MQERIKGEADAYIRIMANFARFVLAAGFARFAALPDNLAFHAALSAAWNGGRRRAGFVGSANLLAGQNPERARRTQAITLRAQNKTPAIPCG